MKHPRLFFTQEDLPRLKQKVQSPSLHPFYKCLLQKCDRWLTLPPIRPPEIPSNEMSRAGGEIGCAQKAQGRVVSLAFAYLLTEKKAYLERAKQELWCFTDEWGSWVDPYHGPSSFYDLMTGEMCLTFGLAYDWLYSALTEEEKQKIREVLLQRGLEPYLFHTDLDRNPQAKGWWFRSYHNWNTVCNGGAVIAALALEGEYPKAEEVLRRAQSSWRRFFDHIQPEGGWDEGTGYWRYGMRYAFLGLEALRSAGKGEGGIFNRPGVRNTAYFPIYFGPRRIAVSFGDSASVATDAIFYLLGTRYRDPLFIAYQDRYGASSEKSEGWPEEVFSILWRPAEAEWLEEKALSRLETARAFRDIGWGILVDSQPEPNIICGFKCGNLGANHTQLDNNSLQLWAYGDWLLIDLGHGSYNKVYFGPQRWSLYEVSTAGHNSLLINGLGQEKGTLGHLSEIRRGKHYVGLVGDATANYPDPRLKRYRRYLFFISQRFFVVVDEVETSELSEVTAYWHFWRKPLPKETGFEVKGETGALGLWSWSPHPLTEEVLYDPGKEMKSPNVPSDWVLRVRFKGSRSLLVTVLYPFLLADSPPNPPQFDWTPPQLRIRMGHQEFRLECQPEGIKVLE